MNKMKKNWVYVWVLGILVYLILWRVMYVFFPCFREQIFEALSSFVAIAAALTGYIQYRNYKEREKYDKLSRLSERFASDKNIQKVMESLLKCYNEDSKCFCINDFKHEQTSDKEMFLRFFEELQYAIDTSSLDEDIVCYYFSYYAVLANLMGKNFVEDYDSGSWTKFIEFAENMKKIADKKKYFHIEISNDNNGDKIIDAESRKTDSAQKTIKIGRFTLSLSIAYSGN